MKTNRWMVWTPRVLGLLFAAFISIFALDVFDEARGFWPTLAALGLHLIPTGVLLLLVGLSWRHPAVGAAVFPLLGIFYIVNFWARFPVMTYVVIAGPVFLLGVLYLLDWRTRHAVEAHV